jgi:hypothetical protein
VKTLAKLRTKDNKKGKRLDLIERLRISRDLRLTQIATAYQLVQAASI